MTTRAGGCNRNLRSGVFLDVKRHAVTTLLAVLLLSSACAPEMATPIGPGDRFGQVGRWTPLPKAPLEPRHAATGVWLDGRFLVLGGWSGPPCPANADCTSPEAPPRRDGAAFDPVAGTWEKLPDAPVPLTGSAVVLGSTLYVLTPNLGRKDAPATFLSYAAADQTWRTLPRPTVSYPYLVATDRAVLAISGSDETTPVRDFAFDPRRELWTALPDDPLGPSFDRAALWTDDRLLLMAHDLVPNPGSERPSLLRMTELDVGRGTWSDPSYTEILGSGGVWASGRVVWTSTDSADGGEVNNWGRSYPYGGILDPATGRWSDLPEPPSARGYPGLFKTVDGRPPVGGHLLDPVALTYTEIPTPPGAPRTAETVVAGDGALLAGGGYVEDDLENLASGHLLRLR